MFDHRTHIVVFEKEHLFIVPSSRCLFPLYWQAEEQIFCAFNEVESIEVTVQELRSWVEGYEKDHQRAEESTICSVSHITRCEAIYGVLPLGGHKNILLFVSSCEDAGIFKVTEDSHRVKRVRGLDWIKLPESTCSHQKVAAVMDKVVASQPDQGPCCHQWESEGLQSSHFQPPLIPSISTPFPFFDTKISSATYNSLVDASNTECESILNSFCQYVGSSGDASSFYFCSSINLAYHPHDLLNICSCTERDLTGGVNNSASRVLSRSATLATFQWNFPLLRPFGTLFSRSQHKIKLSSSCGADSLDGPSSPSKCSDLMCPTRYASLLSQGEMKTQLVDEHEHDFACLYHDNPFSHNQPNMPYCQCRDYHPSSPKVRRRSSASWVSSSVLFYVPGFIRGFFGDVQASSCANNFFSGYQMRISTYLLTRLSYPWAGTRYNRRGLDPGGSGACANMGLSSLWVVGERDPFPFSAPQEDSHKKVSGDTSSETSSNSSSSDSSQEKKRKNYRVAVYEMIRGSIPLMWKQRTNLKVKPKIEILSDSSKSAKEISSHAMLVSQLMPTMKCMICVDCTAKGRGEKILSAAYKEGVQEYQHSRLEFANPSSSTPLPFLIYLNCCIGSLVLKKMKTFSFIKKYLFNTLQEAYHSQSEDRTKIEAHEVNWWDLTKWNNGVSDKEDGDADKGAQSIFLRVNCVDCIDRTTIVQACIVSQVLPVMLKYVVQGPLNNDPIFAEMETCIEKEALRLVREQGHSISVLYSGTSHHLRQYPLRGYVLPHEVGNIFFVMCRRWFHQNFLDGTKQDGVSLITCQYSFMELLNSLQRDPSRQELEEMNRYLCYSIICGVLPFLCVPLGFFFLDRISGCVHFFLLAFWLVALLYTYTKINSASSTIVSRPILSFGGE